MFNQFAGAGAKLPLLSRVLEGSTERRTPIWLMRQAGRYLPEYREVRAKVRSFLELCYSPELAVEVTLQPLRRFDLDAAILFSDILVVPDALGHGVSFVEGEGPKLDKIDANGLARLSAGRLIEHLGPVLETVERVRAALPEDRALIGFCGAPWTVATYMINGGGSSDHAETRLAAARDPELVDRLIAVLVEASAEYLVAQLRAGADVVQIFDSWAGVLGEHEFERWCIAPTAAIVSRIRGAIPDAKIIGFPKGAALRLADYVTKTGIDAVGVDWTTPLGYARDMLKPKAVVQGNLDPMVLVAGGSGLDAEIDRIMAVLGGGRFVFNLGHGIVPQTPIPHVEQLIARVRRHEVAA